MPPNLTQFPQADRLQTLNEIGRVLSATLDLHELYETIYQQIGRVMDNSQFFIALSPPGASTVLEIPYHREQGTLMTHQELPFGRNVTCLVIQGGIELLFDTDAEYQLYARQNGLPELTLGDVESEAKIWVPLNTGNRTIGALSVQSTRVSAYTPDDRQTLAVIASQAAVAIENGRLYAKSRENVEHMEALLQVAQSVTSSLDLQVVLDAILQGMRAVVPYYLAAILLPDQRLQQLNVVGSVGPLSEERRQEIKVPFGRGITGRVFASGECIYVPDISEHEHFISHDLAEIHAAMAVPLKRGETIVGVLDVERAELDSFTAGDLDLLTLFATQAAIAIENASLFSGQAQRVDELHTIQSIVQRLTALHDADAIVSVINAELKQLVDYHSCRIFSVDEATRILVPMTNLEDDAERLHLQMGEGVSGWVAQSGESAIVPNTLLDTRVVQTAGTPVRKESMMGVPLRFQGRTQGVITLSKLGVNQFDDNSLRLLEIIAAQAAIAFDRATLYQTLRRDAITDPLTRLYNRRHLEERFKEERSRAIRNEHSLTALMLDIDKFKRVNDTYGHSAGDIVLQQLGHLIRVMVRAEDLVARYGGEEFSVLLPEIPLADAFIVAERLRAAIERHRLPIESGVRGITVSIGMAVFDGADDEGQLFSRADAAMYEVKRRGGNLVCLLQDDEFRIQGDL